MALPPAYSTGKDSDGESQPYACTLGVQSVLPVNPAFPSRQRCVILEGLAVRVAEQAHR